MVALPLAGLFRKLFEFNRQIENTLAVNVPDHWNEQAPVGVNREPDVMVMFNNDLFRFHIDAGIEAGEFFQRRRCGLHGENRQAQSAALRLDLLFVLAPERLEFGKVRHVHVRYMGNLRPRNGNVFRSGSAHRAQRDSLDRADQVELGRIRGLGGVRAAFLPLFLKGAGGTAPLRPRAAWRLRRTRARPPG